MAAENIVGRSAEGKLRREPPLDTATERTCQTVGRDIITKKLEGRSSDFAA